MVRRAVPATFLFKRVFDVHALGEQAAAVVAGEDGDRARVPDTAPRIGFRRLDDGDALAVVPLAVVRVGALRGVRANRCRGVTLALTLPLRRGHARALAGVMVLDDHVRAGHRGDAGRVAGRQRDAGAAQRRLDIDDALGQMHGGPVGRRVDREHRTLHHRHQIGGFHLEGGHAGGALLDPVEQGAQALEHPIHAVGPVRSGKLEATLRRHAQRRASMGEQGPAVAAGADLGRRAEDRAHVKRAPRRRRLAAHAVLYVSRCLGDDPGQAVFSRVRRGHPRNQGDKAGHQEGKTGTPGPRHNGRKPAAGAGSDAVCTRRGANTIGTCHHDLHYAAAVPVSHPILSGSAIKSKI